MRIQIKSVLPEPPVRRSKIYYLFGKFNFDFPKKVMLFWENFSSPQSVSHYANAVRSVRVGRGFDSPLVYCRSVGLSVEFQYVFPEFGARSSPQFWYFHPEPNFPKNLPLFWDFHPEPNFPKNLPQLFWDFLRIQILGTFVLRFRYFEFTACDCRSLEFTIGLTDISSLLVVGTSVFLVPLTLHWKKAADIGSPS